MGRYRNTGLAHGTSGSPQGSLGNLGYSAKTDELQKDAETCGRRDVPVFPPGPSQTRHIFRKAEGHFPDDTAENRSLILKTVCNNSFRGYDKGNSVYSVLVGKGRYKGKEIWVYVRNGVIQNAGINDIPRYSIKEGKK